MFLKFIVGVLFLQLITIICASSDESVTITNKANDKDYIIVEDGDTENNNQKYINDLKKFVENKFENLQKNIEDTIQQKLERKLREIETKIDELNYKNYELNINNTHLITNLQNLILNNSYRISKINNTLQGLLNITNGLNNNTINNTHLITDLKNICFNNSDNTGITNNTNNGISPKADGCSTEMTLNETLKTNWTQCKEEKVQNGRSIWEQALNLIDDVPVRAPSKYETTGHSPDFHLHIGVLGDHKVHILLSRESRLTRQGLYFVVVINKTEAKLYDMVKNKYVHTVNFTNNLSYTKATGFSVKLDNGTLEVRRDDKAFLVHHEPEISKVKYFGFAASGNSRGYATFLYDC